LPDVTVQVSTFAVFHDNAKPIIRCGIAFPIPDYVGVPKGIQHLSFYFSLLSLRGVHAGKIDFLQYKFSAVLLLLLA
jgi:hypothetical protein